MGNGFPCNACIGRYKLGTKTNCRKVGNRFQCTTQQTLFSRGLQYCHCRGSTTLPGDPAAPFNPEVVFEQIFPPEPIVVIDLPVSEPAVPPPFPITPPIPPQVPPLPPACPNNPPTLAIENVGVFHIVNLSSISNTDIDTQLVLMQRQINNDFAPYWGVTCTLQRSAAVTFGYNVFIRDGLSDVGGSCGYHIESTFGFEIIGNVFIGNEGACTWENTLDHEVLEMLVDPHTNSLFRSNALGPVVTFMGKTGRFIKEVCDPVQQDRYENGKLSDFVYPSWFIAGSPCPWDRLGVLPGPMTFATGGSMSFRENGGIFTPAHWWNVGGDPLTFRD